MQDYEHRLITTHRRLFEKGKQSTHWIDFIDVVVTHPRALKYSGFYSLLPNNWRGYTDKLGPADLKEALHFLRACLLEKDMAFSEKVLEENLLNSVIEPDALWITYYRMMEDPALYQQRDSSGLLPKLPDYKIGLEDYDLFMVKTLADYSFSGIQLPEKLNIEELTELKFLEQHENLILYGGVGTGKTHLGTALGVQAINNEKKVLFYTVHSLINQLVKAKEEHTYEVIIKFKHGLYFCILLGRSLYFPIAKNRGI